ncbi:hypothetical protein Rhow_004123 [Rhodococcus wratislaviensis]|uniref:Uncharacterized protein n=1 Tax=Rhodococcus wratislaviensis TaxID=44752 RepID=A0A402CA30_RHOWR|nr:hypothetical protein Rhow_004123 [Rhodococcus wratislaviensis]
MSGERPVEQGGSDEPHVRGSGGRRAETDANFACGHGSLGSTLGKRTPTG